MFYAWKMSGAYIGLNMSSHDCMQASGHSKPRVNSFPSTFARLQKRTRRFEKLRHPNPLSSVHDTKSRTNSILICVAPYMLGQPAKGPSTKKKKWHAKYPHNPHGICPSRLLLSGRRSASAAPRCSRCGQRQRHSKWCSWQKVYRRVSQNSEALLSVVKVCRIYSDTCGFRC